MNNYQKIMSMHPFDLTDILIRTCPTVEDMRCCTLKDYSISPLEQRCECRRCWSEWLSQEVEQ